MKIWTITTTNGPETFVHLTEEAANRQAVEIVTAWYERFVGNVESDHEDWQESYKILCNTIGFNGCMEFDEHDISAHPALSAVHEILAAFEAGLLDSEDAACNEETATLVEKMIDLVDKTIGKIEADEPTLIEPMPAPELPTFTVIVTERESYPYPLIYDIRIENLDDEAAVLLAVARERCLDLGEDEEGDISHVPVETIQSIADRLSLCFAFKGDCDVAEDWRD
jgi:hypothetical protein